MRDEGRKLRRAEEELRILKQTKKEVDDVETVWKEELKAFESKAFKAIADAQKDARALIIPSSNLSINTTPQIMELLRKQGHPPGSHAASVQMDDMVNNANVFASGSAGSDVLGNVALLACVDNDLLNRALVDYLGIEKMLMIVCRSEEGLKYLQKLESARSEIGNMTLHAFAHSRNRSISGTFRVLILNEASFYKRNDGLPSVDKEHPQKLLLIPDPGQNHKPCRPKGYLGYAVNLLRFNPQQLESYATPAKLHGLRESLFFQIFLYLQVYDTLEHMIAAQEFHTTGVVSLDGGFLHANSFLEHVIGEEPAVKFPALLQEEIQFKNHFINYSTLSSDPTGDKKLSPSTPQLELAQRIKAGREEKGYTQLCLHIEKVESKLTLARSKFSVLMKEINQEDERKTEILRRVALLRD